MIHDDLPSNPEYLDDSFSASAGLRALDDSDLDEFNVEDIDNSSPSTNQDGHISQHGGETVRMLGSDGLRIVDNYYETLPPETTDNSRFVANCSVWKKTCSHVFA